MQLIRKNKWWILITVRLLHCSTHAKYKSEIKYAEEIRKIKGTIRKKYLNFTLSWNSSNVIKATKKYNASKKIYWINSLAVKLWNKNGQFCSAASEWNEGLIT